MSRDILGNVKGRFVEATLSSASEAEVLIGASFPPDKRAIPGVPIVAAIETVTISDAGAEDDTFTVTVNGRPFTVTAPATPTATEVRDLLESALTSGLAGEPITVADVSTDAVSLTADNPGDALVVTASTDGAGDITVAGSFVDADEFGYGIVDDTKSDRFTFRTDGDVTATFKFAVFGS